MQDIWQELNRQILAGQDFFDDQCRSLLVALREQSVTIYCKAGCSNCCTLMVNATFPEALLVGAVLAPEQFDAVAAHAEGLARIACDARDFKDYLRRRRRDLGPCPLLNADGRCGVYAVRPIACRALFATRNSAWCAVDFGTLHSAEKEAFMSSLDPSLVAFPTHYLAATQALGQQLEARAAAAMVSRWGFSLNGSLAFLLFLEQRCRLSALIPQGLAATRQALAAAGYDLPFVVNYDPI
ncbi:Putative zinc-or iron-chelating domain-containing protein [Geoalkalibacter ferrihydriticus]|uniref:Putative zinc-or iron-chelating domain-containing protein n=1 Tax=Geoalkalibacter ferrihydriticus TaxID=392333 RepID=A0A1G9P5E3_9BACT|nr:YkgJ family cysteine cluster protein [Geoalkalibacter ferrihydriticus]SDL93405.1 Putative zinc-or iron-chelating domain-containing protein [Geoalkalibacter ferrihydriticus]